MLRFVTLRHYCGLTPPPTSVPGSSTFVTECGECSIGCKAAPPPPARPNLLQGSICWTHLPNSVNLVKARPPPDMGMLSKARQGPARRGLVPDWSVAAWPPLPPTNQRRVLAGRACRRVTRPDKQIGVSDTARHARQCPVIRLILPSGPYR